MENKNKITLNMNEAARVMGISLPTMRELAQRPDFPSVRVGKRWLISRNLLIEWLETEARKTKEGA